MGESQSKPRRYEEARFQKPQASAPAPASFPSTKRASVGVKSTPVPVAAAERPLIQVSQSTNVALAEDQFDVMISWNYKAEADRLYDDLLKAGFTVWIDKDRMRGSIFDSMEKAVRNSKVVICCLSRSYVSSRNCNHELTYAEVLRKNIVPVRFDTGPFTWAEVITAGLKYCDLSSYRAVAHDWDEKVSELKKDIMNALKTATVFVQPQGTPLPQIPFPLSRTADSAVLVLLQKLVVWLQPVQGKMDDDITALYSTRLKGTRDWMIKDISSWIGRNDQQVLWVTAVAGAGKSVIAASMKRQLEDNDLLAGYFFCKHNDEQRNQPERLLFTLAYQLAVTYPSIAKSLASLQQADPDVLKTAKLTRLFDELIRKPLLSVEWQQPVVVVVDALDECGRADSDPRRELLQLLAQWSQLPPFIKLFITSRPDPDIVRILTPLEPRVLELSEAHNLEDIEQYAKYQMAALHLEQMGASSTQVSDMAVALAKNAGGLFIWLVLRCDEIRDSSDPLQALESMSKPGTTLDHDKLMDQVYESTLSRAFERISTNSLELYPVIVGTIVTARAPIGPTTIAKLANISPGQILTFLRSVSSLLVISDTAIQVIHKSFTDFLVNENRCTDKRFYIDRNRAEIGLAASCITILNKELVFTSVTSPYYKVATMLGKISMPNGHLDYVCRYWMDHLGSVSVDSAILDEFRKVHGVEALLAAIDVGNGGICTQLLNTVNPEIGVQLFNQAETGRHLPNPLLFEAAKRGFASVCDALLRYGRAKVNAKGSMGKYKWTPLHVACYFNQQEVVEVLVKHNADWKILDEDRKQPLGWASGKTWNILNDWIQEETYNVDVQALGTVGTACNENKLAVLQKYRADGGDLAVITPKKRTLLHVAARQGYMEMVIWLLHQGVLVNLMDDSGETPLFVAASKGRLYIVKCLVEQGGDVGFANQDGETPVWAAAAKGHGDIVEYLMDHGGDVKTPTNDGRTPIWTAAYSGHLEVVKHLIEKGGDVKLANHEGQTPLFVAAGLGHLDIVKYLFEHGGDVKIANQNGMTPLFAAAYNGHINVVKWIAENGGDVKIAKQTGVTPLWIAALGGHTNVVKWIAENGGDVKQAANDGRTPLRVAAAGGHLEVVKLLKQHDADIQQTDNEGRSPVWGASYAGHLETVKYLVEQGGDVKRAASDERTPVFVAAQNGHLEVIKFLVEKGGDVKKSDNDGDTPLHMAAQNGHLEVIKYLVEKGGDVKLAAKDGRTPLRAAAYGGHLEVIKYLKQAGADVLKADNEGETPVWAAANGGHIDIVKYLIEQGGDVKLAAKDGRTPLRAAAYGGHLEVIKYLKQAGADVLKADNEGNTPVWAAANGGHLDIVKYLIEQGGDVKLAAKDGRTPIAVAAANGHLEVLKLLKQQGGNINQVDIDGWTPLWAASQNGHLDVIKFLGSDARISNRDKSTPLQAAAESGHLEVVKYLFGTGSDINNRAKKGFTPMYMAAANGHLEVVKYLVEKGAPIKLSNWGSANPLTIARKEGHADVVKHLTSMGAR
ncbi:hypothetical protein SmJEL517_g00124 [Synchytrium microbalum]|uniref:TIR domain-containing protein n=1 Tax=Synchytrium microbalum TaxID=1806994 RepID=A0A507CIN3_9FUNG|nr:uncharacterized protein SmJEL517_g00124 [Synchytrium microbalum]TPX38086.1 hypothetical protein SmJEL517_g00124 [Synchytrium microbalum]